MKDEEDISILNDNHSLDRPAYSQYDLYAYKHKHSYNKYTKKAIQKNHFEKTNGIW